MSEIDEKLREIIDFHAGIPNIRKDAIIKSFKALVVASVPKEVKYGSNEFANGHDDCRTVMLSTWSEKSNG